MLNLSDQYKNSIIAMFGQQGQQWLADVPNIIEKYINKFHFKDITALGDLTFNIILFANCEEFGDVILKIGLPYNELLTRETIALSKFGGRGACKCYYNNIDDGIIILERLKPGETLHCVKDREKRIRAFCDVASALSTKADDSLQLPTYREILDRSIDKSKEEAEKFKSLCDLIATADALYKEIEDKNLTKYLLHADLHHSNILTCIDGRKSIDPHGFIGERVMETSRFMENEIQKKGISPDNIMQVVEMVSKYYNEDKQMLCKALFIDYVLSTCWDIELNFDNKHINNDIQNLNLILDCVKNNFDNKEKSDD